MSRTDWSPRGGRPFPRISTRGYYDLHDGRTLRTDPYRLFPRSFFDSITGAKEIVIMMHGLRNSGPMARDKFVIAHRRLRRLGYGHPVVGYSYDSNTRGAHLEKSALRALRVGQRIAKKNGRNLARFILDFKRSSPQTRIRLMGHSLGSEVILHTVENLARDPGCGSAIESVHFFGASVTAAQLSSPVHARALQRIVASRIVNYFSPEDDVLGHAHGCGAVTDPIGYRGCSPGRLLPKYAQRRVRPQNHRFASYAATLRSFP